MDYGDARLPERFWAKVYPEPNTGCWLWGAGTFHGGYPQYWTGIRLMGGHRFVLMVVTGEDPPKDIHTCHSCDQPQCVNPEHLRWGTAADNIADRDRQRHQVNQRKTECLNGHRFDAVNTYITKMGRRHCRKCHQIREAQRRAGKATRHLDGSNAH